jgi:hypothetical protein
LPSEKKGLKNRRHLPPCNALYFKLPNDVIQRFSQLPTVAARELPRRMVKTVSKGMQDPRSSNFGWRINARCFKVNILID